MSKRGPESYMKRQKELKRKQKAMEKLARRQAKKLQKAAGIPETAEEGDIPVEDLVPQEGQEQYPASDPGA